MADKAVFGIATSEAQAQRIANQLKAAGFSGNDISVLFPDKAGSRDFAHEQHTKAPEGAAAGAGTGGLLGGGLGWLVGIGALAIPGVGPFIAAGPIMAALAVITGSQIPSPVTGPCSSIESCDRDRATIAATMLSGSHWRRRMSSQRWAVSS